METKPNEVDEDELREAVSKHWEIDEVRSAFIHAKVPQMPDLPFEMPPHDTDEKGRVKFPAYLLSAHKAGYTAQAPSSRRNPSGITRSAGLRSCTDECPRPSRAESMPPRMMSRTFSTPA